MTRRGPDEFRAEQDARNKAKADNTATIQERLVPIFSIVREPALMMGIKQDDATVKKYAAAMAGGAVFPPIEIMEVDKRLLLTGGAHRTAAVELNGGTDILAHVRAGTWQDAVLAAARADAHGGLKRSNKDKRKTVEALLTTDWGKTSSDHMVAEAAGVSQPFVTKLRPRSTDNGYQSPSTRKGKDGKRRPSTRPQTGSAASPAPPAQAIEEEQLDRVCAAADLSPPDEALITNEPASAIPNPEPITRGVQDETESPRPASTCVNTDAGPSVSTLGATSTTNTSSTDDTNAHDEQGESAQADEASSATTEPAADTAVPKFAARRALDPQDFLNASPEDRAAYVELIGYEAWLEAGFSLKGGKLCEINSKSASAIVKTLNYAFGQSESGEDAKAAAALRGIVSILKRKQKTYHDFTFTLGKKLVGTTWGRRKA